MKEETSSTEKPGREESHALYKWFSSVLANIVAGLFTLAITAVLGFTWKWLQPGSRSYSAILASLPKFPFTIKPNAVSFGVIIILLVCTGVVADAEWTEPFPNIRVTAELFGSMIAGPAYLFMAYSWVFWIFPWPSPLETQAVSPDVQASKAIDNPVDRVFTSSALLFASSVLAIILSFLFIFYPSQYYALIDSISHTLNNMAANTVAPIAGWVNDHTFIPAHTWIKDHVLNTFLLEPLWASPSIFTSVCVLSIPVFGAGYLLLSFVERSLPVFWRWLTYREEPPSDP